MAETALIGVNPDRRESDLQPIRERSSATLGWTFHSVTRRPPQRYVQEKNTEHSIWWYVMLLVLVAAVAESIVASRYLGTQREEA